MGQGIVKWNNGNLALICNRCASIIKTGSEFTKEENSRFANCKPFPVTYCKNCITNKKTMTIIELENAIKDNIEYLNTTEGDEVPCISIENLEGILQKFCNDHVVITDEL